MTQCLKRLDVRSWPLKHYCSATLSVIHYLEVVYDTWLYRVTSTLDMR